MIKVITIISLISALIFGIFYWNNSTSKRAFKAGEDKQLTICQEEKLELKNKITKTYAKAIEEKSKIIKRKQINRNTSFYNNINWLRQNSTKSDNRVSNNRDKRLLR